ncbi:regulator of DNA class I crossover intermediates 1 isoform X3 [Pseudophryne corroboree]|uniref:regulator of DNA class I crossover intermediates 1 isoform X3 n=1 Tax=Pseudophryne corroboree TaxID=495146 RepID=UPI0030819DB0
MNWVGGSRNRIIFKRERQKQKDFFEKKKLKSKLERLELASPKKESVSLDLLSLYVVNQVSRKKEMNKKPQHVDICNTNVLTGRNNAELPMSPITVPSKICLEESEIISSQMPNIEFRINPNTLNCPSNQSCPNSFYNWIQEPTTLEKLEKNRLLPRCPVECLSGKKPSGRSPKILLTTEEHRERVAGETI